MKKYILFFLIAGSFLSFAYTVDDVPNPKSGSNGYVSNPDAIITSETSRQIDLLLQSLEDSSGFQVAVVLVETIGEENPKNFATTLFNKWGIGQKGKDNGLLILLVKDQHRVEFETGYGTEAVLTDALCKRIQLNQMVPAFKKNEYDAGMLAGIQSVKLILENPENIAAIESGIINQEDVDRNFQNAWIIGGFFLFTVLIAFIIEKRKYLFNRGNKKVTKKQRNRTPISMGWWLIIYALVPLAYFAVFSVSYKGEVAVGFGWLIVGVYGLILFFLVENRFRSAYHINRQYVKEDYFGNYKKFTDNTQYWFWAAIFFPVPFVFYWIYCRIKRKQLRNMPRKCTQCGSEMHKLDEKADDAYLDKSEVLEENLRSIDYDVWACTQCDNKQILKFDNIFSQYSACPSCSAKAFYMSDDITLVDSTYSSTGKGQKTYTCKNCNFNEIKTYTIAVKTRSSGSSGGGGGSSGSWGGGSSGGGGAGSSW